MRSQTKIITFNGVVGTISKLANLYNLPPTTVAQRLKLGWSVEKALTTKSKRKHFQKFCSIPNCSKFAHSKNLCVSHYSKQRYTTQKRENKVYNCKYYLNDKTPEARLLYRAKQRAEKYNIPFNLEISDIVIPKICPVLNIPLQSSIKLYKTDKGPSRGFASTNSPSLDRIIPSKGYVKGNVRVISNRANLLKNNGTLEEFENIVKYLKSSIPQTYN